MMTNTSSETSATESLGTPGQILRYHREKLKLSQEEIAKRIHLDIKIIEAIELDSNNDMLTATYIKGYLRNYAKIVNADADQIIQLYNTGSPQQQPEILPEVKPPSQVSSSDKPVKAFTYLITLGLVFLLFIWFQSEYVIDTSNNNEPENYNSETTINGVDITYDVIKHPEGWQSPKNLSPPSTTDTDSVQSASPTTEDDMLELRSDNGEESLGIMPIAGIENSATTTAIGTGPDTIEMTLTRDSWIDIRDATKKRLFHDLALGGEKYNVRGTAPFKLLFGFSPAVTIKFNGKAFDHSPFSNNGIARFNLPK